MRESGRLPTLRWVSPAPGVVLVVLDRPEAGNAVVPETVRDLAAVWDEMEADFSIRAVVLTGAGRIFCSGADLVALADHLAHEQPRTNEPLNARALFPFVHRLTAGRLPVIAAVNGPATAGGLDLALACDIRLASDTARFGETYVRVGLTAATGGTWFLPRLVGPGLAAELALTGEIIDAARALEIGLVNRVLPDGELLSAAVELAATIAVRPRQAVEATRSALRAAWDQDLATATQAGFWAVTALSAGRDVREGVAAARDKREPVFAEPPPPTHEHSVD